MALSDDERVRHSPWHLLTHHASLSTHHSLLITHHFLFLVTQMKPSMAAEDEPAAGETHFIAFVVNAVKRHVYLAAGAAAQGETERLATGFAVGGDVIAALTAGDK